MIPVQVLLLIGASVVLARASSCGEEVSNAGVCSTGGHMDGADSSELYLLQTDLVVRSKVVAKHGDLLHTDLGERARVRQDSTDDNVEESPRLMPPVILPAGIDAMDAEAVAAPNDQENIVATKKPCDTQAVTEKPCGDKKCMPQCTWQCDTPKCEEVCEPECLKPVCQTRCPALSKMTLKDAGCKWNCEEPKCQVQCPKTGCGARDCPQCKTVCHNPECKLDCHPLGESQCAEVCKDPQCTWNCKAPKECPKPKCTMTCEKPSGCGGMPALTNGMVVVDNFAPASSASSPTKPKTSLLSIASNTTGSEGAEALKFLTARVGVVVASSHGLQLEYSDVELPL